MSKVEVVSRKELQKHIKKYRRLNNRSFTLSSYLARSRIEKRAEDIIDSYEKGDLVLRPEQYEDFAKYIEVFAWRNKEKCFDKLQQKADFNVREVAKQDNRSIWQKIYDSLRPKEVPQAIEYLPAKQLYKKIKRYEKIFQRVSEKPWLSKAIRKFESDAETYIKAYLKGEIKIEPEDAVAFKKFIKVMADPIYKGSDGELALQKLHKEYGDILKKAREEEKNVVKVPLWTRIKNNIQNTIKNKRTEVKEHFVKNQKWYGRAAAGIVGLVTVGALWLGLKNNSDKEENVKLTNQAKTEIKTAKAETKVSDEKLIHFEFVSNEYKGIDLQTLMETAPKKEVKTAKTTVAKESNAPKAKVSEVKTAKTTVAKESNAPKAKVSEVKTTKTTVAKENNAPKAKVSEVKTAKTTGADKATLATNANDSVKLARINHHKVVLEMRLGEEKSENMVDNIQDKMDKGLIALPANLSAEDFVYAMEMYRGYGVESSLKDAFDKTQKLSPEENKKVIEDIIAAGETGLGVKKMAEVQNGGKLNYKSVYNRASKKTQQQHNKNLQQLFKAKKKAARAA